MAVDVNPSEDDHGEEQHGQNDAHDGARVNRGARLRGRKAAPHTCGTSTNLPSGLWNQELYSDTSVPWG